MYREMDDPEHQGNLVDALEIIQELMGEHDTRSEFFEQNPPLEETEPDPLLFPEDSGFEDAVLATPEAPVTGMSKSFDRSAYLESMKVGKFSSLVSPSSLTACTAERLHSISQTGSEPEFLGDFGPGR